MRRFLSPFILVLTAILAVVYAYLAWRLAPGPAPGLALAVPFVLIWLVPVIYWVGERESEGLADEALHFVSYLCMGWLSFTLVLSLGRDGLLLATAWAAPLADIHALLRDSGATLVIAGSLLGLAVGALTALRGPRIREVEIRIDGPDRALAGTRIVQITDLHVGPTIRAGYVRRVVRMANGLAPDLVAITGDIVDGSVARLASEVAPLGELIPGERVFFVPGNHEYYSGAEEWISHFRTLGFRVLLNEYAAISIRGARLVVGGVIDPAARMSDREREPRPDLASGPGEGPCFRLLLAHNPKLAGQAEAAGFDLQLSGHTHAGQFFPWTLAVRLVHGPHAAGLSRMGRMWIYVSAGTGSWGPPVRFGSEPELTLIRLV